VETGRDPGLGTGTDVTLGLGTSILVIGMLSAISWALVIAVVCRVWSSF